jgi:2-C-methyl-D-erythritol 4-phosphate cytidylyltransferase
MSSLPNRCWAVIPAAGIGARMGSEFPKQYLEIAGTTLLEYSLGVLLACDWIDSVVVVLHPQDEYADTMACFGQARVIRAQGGAERMDSVLAGLAALASKAAPEDWVLVHDAARPCLLTADLQRLRDLVLDSSCGAILAEPIVDTVKRSDAAGQVEQTLERSSLWRAQTPQMFRLGELQEALLSARAAGAEVTDEASAMELAGKPVGLVPGSPTNLKVTVPEDLELARWYLERQLNGVI